MIARSPHLPFPSLEGANWIWHPGSEENLYNIACHFTKRVFIPSPWKSAQIVFSADCRCRIWINGQWLGDGPCRGWPHNYYVDHVDAGSYLIPGDNEITALVQYDGTGTFHQIPQRPGFLCALEILFDDGERLLVQSGDDWDVRSANELRRETPKISLQLPPFEWFDANASESTCHKAVTIAEAGAGPWSGLRARDVARQGITHFELKAPVALRLLEKDITSPFAIPVRRLVQPGLIATNLTISRGAALLSKLVCHEVTEVSWPGGDWRTFIDGKEGSQFTLEVGTHVAVAFVKELFSDKVEAVFDGPVGSGFVFSPFLDQDTNFPWVFLPLEEMTWLDNDIRWIGFPDVERESLLAAYEVLIVQLGTSLHTIEAAEEVIQRRKTPIPTEQVAVSDPHQLFMRRVVARLDRDVPSEFPMRLSPDSDGDLELEFDLGIQRCGFYSFDIEAPEGTILDLFVVEFCDSCGKVQHTEKARNGFRYVCKAGRQKFFSFRRRSGRHVFLRIRNPSEQVIIHNLKISESLYPAQRIGEFQCSDPMLESIWAAAMRTMELSMDEVYIDSLYEQTLWVGDARVEQLYGLYGFDARDISLRSMRLAADSLYRMPLIGAQAPSCWETIIPAWSFLWTESVWEYYVYHNDPSALKEMWPAIWKNMVAACTYLNRQGLFEGPFWNFLDWADLDCSHECVVYNSMLLYGALGAASHCASELGEKDAERWIKSQLKRIRTAVQSTYNDETGLFPDSINAAGEKVGRSLHSQFLALHYRLTPDSARPRALQTILEPTEDLLEIASPFVLHSLFEALDAEGHGEEIVKRIRKYFTPMINAGSTTLWEALPGSLTSPDGWPTRSHCHGWSCSPIVFLPRVVLGIRPVGVGSHHFVISPSLGDLEWASGVIATPHGPLRVAVSREGDSISVEYSAPSGVTVQVEKLPCVSTDGGEAKTDLAML